MLRYISVITCSFGFAIAAQANMITNGSFELPPIRPSGSEAITIDIYPQFFSTANVATANTVAEVELSGSGRYIGPSESDAISITIDIYPQFSFDAFPAFQLWFDPHDRPSSVSHTFLFNLTPDTYTLSFAPLGSFRDPLLDNINVTISTMNVPEPATFTLISLGLAGMAFGKRRKLT